MYTQAQIESIIYQSQVQILEKGLKVAKAAKYGTEYYQKDLMDAYRMRVMIHALQRDSDQAKLTLYEKERLYACLIQLASIQDYPAANTVVITNKPALNQGAPGPPGPKGTDGVDGSDATVNVESSIGNIEIQETEVGGIRTFTLVDNTYAPVAVSINIDTASLPGNSKVQEIGTEIAILTLNMVINKGRDDVQSAEVTPAALDGDFQTALDLAAINANGSQNITLNPTGVTEDTTYTIMADDGSQTPQDSDSISFEYPYLFGDSAGLSITHYSELSKKVQGKANQVVTFNGTDLYFWFGYHNSYGDLARIKDGNGFVVTTAFTKITVSVTSTGLDNNWTEDFIFYRTTSPTDIPNQNYTFEFN
jgi:hypothetical protein